LGSGQHANGLCGASVCHRPGRNVRSCCMFCGPDCCAQALPQRAGPLHSGAMTPEEEARALRNVVDRVGQRRPEVERAEMADLVRQRAAEFDGRPIRNFVRLLVEGGVMGDLRAGPSRATHNR
jgi:hypothetical protein